MEPLDMDKLLKPINGPGWLMRWLLAILFSIAIWHFTKVDAALNNVINMQGSISQLTAQIKTLNTRLARLENYYIDDLRKIKK